MFELFSFRLTVTRRVQTDLHAHVATASLA